jgi:hypothetical protein
MTLVAISVWQKNTIYAPGSGVQPASGVVGGASPPTNPAFESGSLTGWTPDAGWTWDNVTKYAGTASANFIANSFGQIFNNNKVTVKPGQIINAQCVVYGGGGGQGVLSIFWYDGAGVLLTSGSSSDSVLVMNGLASTWYTLKVTGTAPNGAAKAAVGFSATTTVSYPLNIDNFAWDYLAPDSVNPQFFTAIQTGTGTSGSVEPDWTNGGTNVGNVTDGTVTWARGVQSIITWTAQALCKSGAFEPSSAGGWGTIVGGLTPDSTFTNNLINWECQSPIILDANCPQSKYVAIAASKIFAGDTDILRYCATLNPQDWTSENDAGFLGTGLQAHGANSISAVGLYRGNVCVFNSEGCLMYQVDEDPGNMSLLDSIPIGSVWHKALAPVNNDLFFLAAQGVRSMGISGGSSNLQAGDVGMPIDPIIQAGIAYCKTNSFEPVAIYYPSAGQYWIVFPGWIPSAYFTALAQSGPYASGESVFVYTMNRTGEVGAWCRYVFPFSIQGFCMRNDDLCIHTWDDDVLVVDPRSLQDFQDDTYLGGSRAMDFPGAVQWPYLDFGQTGVTKQFDMMDISCAVNANVTVQIGYDQSNPALLTDPFTVASDSVPGMQIPIPMMAASISPRLTFTSSEDWQVEALNVYIQESGENS